MKKEQIRNLLVEVAKRSTSNEKKQEQLVNEWYAMIIVTTGDNEDFQNQFFILYDQFIDKGIGKVISRLKAYIIARRELNSASIINEIQEAAHKQDEEKLMNVLQSTFLEYINKNILNYIKKAMERHNWTWEKLIEAYSKAQGYRLNTFLNRPCPTI